MYKKDPLFEAPQTHFKLRTLTPRGREIGKDTAILSGKTTGVIHTYMADSQFFTSDMKRPKNITLKTFKQRKELVEAKVKILLHQRME